MRTEIPLCILFAFALLTGVSAAPGSTVIGPRLTIGDSWTYRTNTSLGPAFFFDGHVSVSVVGQGPVTVEGATYDAVRTSVSGAGTAAGTYSTEFGSTPASGSWVFTGQEVLESAGLKVVSSVVDLEASGSLHTELGSIRFQLRLQNTTAFRLLDDTWRFPLGIGNSTTVSSEMNFSEDFRLFYGFPTSPVQARGRVWWNVTYTLEMQVSVDAPAGRFDAYRIRVAYPDGTYSLLYYAPATGNYARTEAYNGTSEIASSELVSYRYQALEAPRLLGLTLEVWTILGLGGGVAGFVVTLWWLRYRRRPTPPMGPQLPPT